jgi:asparagine synthase (glutamine-hydrolysing)
MHALAEFARRQVTVVLGGEGADELFCDPRYTWLSRAERLHRLAPAPALALANAGAAALGGSKKARRLRDLLTDRSNAVRSASWVTTGGPDARDGLYGERLRPFRATLDSIVGPGPVNAEDGCAVTSAMRRDQMVWLPDDVLMKTDSASMRASLELRTPYLDRSLAEFASCVPIEVHRRGGRKVAFRTPTGDWLRGPLRPLVQEHVLLGSLTADGWFDQSALTRLAERHWNGNEDHTSVLWPALVLGMWLDAVKSEAPVSTAPAGNSWSRT